MKKLLLFLLVLTMLLGCCACAAPDRPVSGHEPSDTAASSPDAALPEEPASADSPAVSPSEPAAGKDEAGTQAEPSPSEAPEEPDPDAPLTLAAQVNRYYGMYDEGMACYVDYPRLRLTGSAAEAFPALADALDAQNAAVYQEASTTGVALAALPRSETIYTAEITQYVSRADRQALCVLYSHFLYEGGASSGYDYSAVNLSPETGAALTPEDVFCDIAGLPALLEDRLREAYPDVAFHDLPQVLSSGSVFEEDGDTASSPEYVWVLGYESAEFYFQPGLIADQALGPLHVTLRFDAQPGLVKEAFLTRPRVYAEPLAHQTQIRSDLDGDGAPDTLRLEVPTALDGVWSAESLRITLNGTEQTISCPEGTAQVQVYLLHLKGTACLYAQCTDGDGVNTLLVISLDGSAALRGTYPGLGLHLREENEAYWTDLLTDPSQFLLDERRGAADGALTAAYHAGADGLPALITNP